MSETYLIAKKVIENKTYADKGEFTLKLDVFLIGDRISKMEYDELIALINA